jgi:hypothetical protein
MNTQPIAIASSEIPQRSAKSSLVLFWWSQLCDRMAMMLLQEQEPIVTEKQDAEGTYWHIYDPNSNRSVWVRSQHDAIAWIEQKRLYKN